MLGLIFWRDTTALIFLAGCLGDGFGSWLKSAHVDPLISKFSQHANGGHVWRFKTEDGNFLNLADAFPRLEEATGTPGRVEGAPSERDAPHEANQQRARLINALVSPLD